MSTLRQSVINLQEEFARDKRALATQLERYIEEVKKSLETLRNANMFTKNLKTLEELLHLLRNERDKFLKAYTFEIYNSPARDTWKKERLNRFYKILSQIQDFLRILDLESVHVDKAAIEKIIEALPEEAINLKNELEKLRAYFDKAHELFKSEHQVLALERLLEEVPFFLPVLRTQISDHLLKLEALQRKRENGNQQVKMRIEKTKDRNKELQEELENYKQIAKIYFEKLLKVNANTAGKVRKFIDELEEIRDINRVKGIAEQMKLTYIKAKEEYLSLDEPKERIRKEAKKINLPEVIQLADEYVKRDKLTIDDYVEFMQKATEISLESAKKELLEKERKKVIEVMSEELSKQGYRAINEDAMEKLFKGEVVELETPFGEDYVIRLKIDEKIGLAVRFIRYVDSEENLSEYEKEKDTSIAKRWCSTYDNLKELLKQNGIILEDVHRIEPEQRFYYEIRKEERKTAKKEGAKIYQERKKSS